MTSMRALTIAFLTAALACFGARPLSAQVTMRGGNPSISITTGAAGGQPVSVISTSSSIRWAKKTVISKITVSTSCPGQRFSLKVLAINLSSGVAAPAVTLTNGMLASDFLTSIPANDASSRTCTLQYTASATFAQGNSTELGNDVHTVTYTMLAQ
ncbi:MAG TPA: hypothetical protein VL126_03565 [Bacteroidota bacterium]|nr:hypothetical protein [Bacteroidota bacterium]